MDFGIDRRFNGKFVIEKFVIENFTFVSILNSGAVVREEAVLHSSLIWVTKRQQIVEEFTCWNDNRIYWICQKGEANLVVDETTIIHSKCTSIEIQWGRVVFKKAVIDVEIGPTINPYFIIDKFTAWQIEIGAYRNCLKATDKFAIGIGKRCRNRFVGKREVGIWNLNTVSIQNASLRARTNKTLPSHSTTRIV